MMIQRVLMRLGVGLLSIIGALFIGAIAAKEHIETRESGSKTFFPERIAIQASAVYQALQSPLTETKVSFPCSARSTQFLGDLIAVNENIDSENAVRRLDQLWKAAASEMKPACSTFPYVLSIAYKAKSIASTAYADPTDLIKSLLAQNIKWDSSIFCLYLKAGDKNYLIGKLHLQCLGSHPTAQLNAEQKNVLDRITPLLETAENRKFRLPKGKRLDNTLSLDLELQVSLDRFLQNQVASYAEVRSKRIDFLKNLHTAAVVILDADSSQLLAASCIGEGCNTREKKNLGLFAATSIEVPPASTAKLVFALAIADMNEDVSKILPLELKTSGQLGHQVSKRNEWWEKQAICDGKQESSCTVPIAAAHWAADLGWNKNCGQKPSAECGRSSIFSPLGIPEFNPLLGRLLVNYSKGGAFMDNNNLTKSLLRWADYDAIRNGKYIAEPIAKLPRTSLVVQSVIGAGNNRVSPLGLAQLSAAIHQASSVGTVYEPSIFDTQPATISSKKKDSPEIVLLGMQKVVQPAEAKWIGDGTARAAFVEAFGMDCPKKCPVYAKTGTVSMQDPAFAGTTLLTVLVQSQAFDEALSRAANPNRKNLAIGVIFRPKRPGGPHYASNLGMKLVKNYIYDYKYENSTASP